MKDTRQLNLCCYNCKYFKFNYNILAKIEIYGQCLKSGNPVYNPYFYMDCCDLKNKVSNKKQRVLRRRKTK